MKPIEKYTNEDLLDRLLGEVGEGWEAPAEQAELLRRLEAGAQAIRERDAMVEAAEHFTGSLWAAEAHVAAYAILAASTKGQEEGKDE